ncbi:FUSC family protein [Mumia sp. DW29H23]|uniref:FUSC family protein n=1 Tax=Mumia sp. DW29H23 TaxID=3421241 RepID=UPI003D694242
MTTAAAPDGVPQPEDYRQMLLRLAPAPGRWRAALIATLALVLPATALTLADWGHDAVLVSMGAFTAMYATDRAYRIRAPFLAVVAVLIVTAAFVGGLAGDVPGAWESGVALVVTLTVVSGLAVFGANALAFGPPGGFFLALVTGLAAHVTHVGTPLGTVVAAAAIGAASAWVVSMTPALWAWRRPQTRSVATAVGAVEAYAARARADQPSVRARDTAARALHDAWGALADAGTREGPLFDRLYEAHLRFAAAIADPHAPPSTGTVAHVPLGRTEAATRLRSSAHALSADVVITVRVVVAVALSGVLAYALGTGRADWAMVSAVLILHTGVDRVRNTYRALQRVVGTVVGVGLFAVLALLEPQGLLLVAVLGVLQLVIEMLVVRNYGVAVVFITALVLLISEPPGDVDLGIVSDRVLDTLIGAAVAVTVLWLTGRRFNAGVLPYEVGRTATAIRALAEVLEGQPPTTPAAARARRTLQVELLASSSAADTAYRQAPVQARAAWPAYAQTQELGYDLLAHCWLAGTHRTALPDTLRGRITDLPPSSGTTRLG